MAFYPRLDGLTVLVTRPKPQGDELCNRVQAAGGRAIYFPTIEIVPPSNFPLFEKQITELAQYDWLIFISPQAVYQSAKKIHSAWSHFPPHVKIAAVGGSTAQALHDVNLPVSLFPQTEWCSEGLLNLPDFHQIQGKKIALVSGEGGLDLLNTTLTNRGAMVTKMLAYRRCLPKCDPQEYINLLQGHKIDIIVCTSAEMIQNLKILLGDIHWAELRATPILVVSKRLVDFADQLGFEKKLLANNASHGAIMAILAKEKDGLCRMKSKKK